jgi:tetratricopeptide (TPR) repeat protein
MLRLIPAAAILLAAPVAAQTARDNPAAAAQRDLAAQSRAAPQAAPQVELADPAPSDRARYDGCVRAIPTNAAAAEAYANEWRVRGGGLPARHCLALAQLAQDKPGAAAATLEAAARAAETERSPVAADFWGQAGNAALLANDARAAVRHFGAALALNPPPAQQTALRVDRARAAVEAGDAALARTDLDAATRVAPGDPAGWLLSAALARRASDLPRARTDIAQAIRLDPTNPDVRLEAANIAAASGDLAAARTQWQALVAAAPGTPAADLAQRALSSGETAPPVPAAPASGARSPGR